MKLQAWPRSSAGLGPVFPLNCAADRFWQSCQSRSPDQPLWIWPQCSSTLFQSGARRSHTRSQGLEVDRKLQFCPLLDHLLCLSTARNREAWRKLVLRSAEQSSEQPLTCWQMPWLNSELRCPSKKNVGMFLSYSSENNKVNPWPQRDASECTHILTVHTMNICFMVCFAVKIFFAFYY